LTHDNGLEAFKLEKYNDFAENDNDASPYENAEVVLNKAKKFVTGFGTHDVNNMLIIGGTGVGKTHLCSCIAYELTNKGIPVLYMSAAELFDTLTYFGDDDTKRARREQLERILYSVELLIIDDLGTEKQSAARYNILIEILNQRSGNKGSTGKTIVSSNLSLEDIKRQYDERIYSRLSTFEVCHLTGSDNRLKK
jgi:DNA replication protein DnaC